MGINPKLQELLSHERIYFCPSCLGNFKTEPGMCSRHSIPVPLQSVATAKIMQRLSVSMNQGSVRINHGLQRVTQRLTEIEKTTRKKRK